jgi:hypothetical protein
MTSTDTAQRLQQQITDGIAALSRDRQWVALLDLTARTGSRYSLGNLILIGAARPDATCVAGYGAWLKAGRQVRRGERGIRILAPIIARRPAQPDHDTRNDAPAPDHAVATGNAGTAQPARRGNRTGPARTGRVVGFRPVVVFAIEQTDGPPLPGDTAIDGYTPHGLREALTEQIKAFGYQVQVGDCGPAFGVTRRADRTVTILPDQPPAQDLLTLAHELGHLACGHLDEDGAGYTHRGTAEVEAESVAYILLTAAGMDTAAASFDYIGTWAKADQELLRSTANTVIRAARPLLAALGLTPANPTDPATPVEPADATDGDGLAVAG